MCQGGHWTLDNAEVNVTFMKAFEELMQARDIRFDYEDNRIMCFPHITNICTTHVVESFTNPTLADDQAEFDAASPPLVPDEQTYDEACGRDPIALCRSTVRAIRASGKRRDHLRQIIREGNAKGWFKSSEDPNVTIQIPELELLHDVRTRWDSIFSMIHRFRVLRLVSNP
jgi:hypothetical protein